MYFTGRYITHLGVYFLRRFDSPDKYFESWYIFSKLFGWTTVHSEAETVSIKAANGPLEFYKAVFRFYGADVCEISATWRYVDSLNMEGRAVDVVNGYCTAVVVLLPKVSSHTVWCCQWNNVFHLSCLPRKLYNMSTQNFPYNLEMSEEVNKY